MPTVICDIFGICNFSNMHQASHVSYNVMLRAYYLLVAPITCAVHVTLT